MIRATHPSILPLSVEQVSFSIGSLSLLRRLSFEVFDDPCTIVLGPNGAGKSLTLRICHGLLRPTSGAVRWRGAAGRDAPRHQAMVFQRPILLRRSALRNVCYALALRGVPRAARADQAHAALAAAGLAPLTHRPARALSIGEQQRLALARAWAVNPQVLFLDEPTASLDPAAMHAIEKVIVGIQQSGTRIVMTTHDLGQARRLAHAVIFLHHGKVLEHGPAARFFACPRTPEARSFLEGNLSW
ncbi:MAG: ATP-binding cassette domain-containing protein [Acidobacteriota bacterium]